LPPPGDWIVALFAGVLLHLAYAALMTEIRRTGDARLLLKAGRGESPVDGRRSVLVGTLHADAAVLHAPCSGAECVGYSYEVYHFEHTGGRRGSSRTPTRVTDFSGLALASCTIRTGQGDFRLLAYPFLSGVPERRSTDQSQRERAAAYIRTTTFEKLVPVLGELTTLDSAMLEVEGSLRKDWRITDNAVLDDATFMEQCIPNAANVCAFGIYSG
jgi:hypothetical protein